MEALKEKWECPELSLQQFSPQEYITACYRWCCDCESYVSSLGTFYEYAGTIPYGQTGWTGDTFKEKTTGLLHYGTNSSGSVDYKCHTSNQNISPATIQNLFEIWNTNINGTISSPYGANLPVETGTTFTPYPNELPNYTQKLVVFTDGNGKTHYGRMEAIPGHTWNHS